MTKSEQSQADVSEGYRVADMKILGRTIGQKATVTSNGRVLRIGRDFADSVGGAVTSHGIVRLRSTSGESEYPWTSSLGCAVSETALYRAAACEGRKVTFMQSQAVEEDDEGAEEGAGT